MGNNNKTYVWEQGTMCIDTTYWNCEPRSGLSNPTSSRRTHPLVEVSFPLKIKPVSKPFQQSPSKIKWERLNTLKPLLVANKFPVAVGHTCTCNLGAPWVRSKCFPVEPLQWRLSTGWVLQAPRTKFRNNFANLMPHLGIESRWRRLHHWNDCLVNLGPRNHYMVVMHGPWKKGLNKQFVALEQNSPWDTISILKPGSL